MSLRLGDLGGGQTRTWARPAGRRSPREKTGEAYDPSQILQLVSDKLHPTPTQPHIGAKSGACDSLTD